MADWCRAYFLVGRSDYKLQRGGNMKTYLTRRKKGYFLKKVAPVCSEALQAFIDENNLQNNEVESFCGLAPNRVSEALGGTLSEPSFIKLLEGGIVTSKIITERCTLVDEEKKYLQSFASTDNRIYQKTNKAKGKRTCHF
jgi:hypothetical protein